jgi:hypothetical protein
MELDIQRIANDIVELRAEVADLHRRLDVVEEKPQEILEEITRIWEADPETGDHHD